MGRSKTFKRDIIGKMGKKKVFNKEDFAEDWCFVCKDGGLLRICDFKDCLKGFHPRCVERDDSFLESDIPWNCKWHSCFICANTPKFHCFCCPKAVCGRCLCDAEFAVLTMKKGFCAHCSTLIGLIEGIKKPDCDEEKIDFSDRETYEFLFKPYWQKIKTKEGLTSKHVRSAIELLNKNQNYGCGTESDNVHEEEEDFSNPEDDTLISDYDDINDSVGPTPRLKRKSKKEKECLMKRNVKSTTKEFIGWGSKTLFDFLVSIGKDIDQELSQSDVTDIVLRYCKEHKLFDSEKKKKVLCDDKLQSLLRRKSINKNSINKCLSAHFASNIEQSEDELGHSSEESGNNVSVVSKRQPCQSAKEKSQKKEVAPNVQKSCFASVIAENIKLVYLKRSLVEELSMQPKTFDAKVMGSFVRVKSDPNDYLQKNSHLLVQVTGIKRSSGNGAMNSDVLLQLSNVLKDLPICKLSDDNFSKEECEDLQQRVKDGWLKRPTVVEWEEKARSLHEDITKHWIATELVLLQKLIDRANEKGWRRELSEYVDRMMLLRTPAEQLRLLSEAPEIIADELEVEPTSKDLSRKDKQEHNALPEPPSRGTSEHFKNNGNSCFLNGGPDVAEKLQFRGSVSKELHQPSDTIVSKSKDESLLQMKRNESFPQEQSDESLPENPYQPGNPVSGQKQKDKTFIKQEKVKKQKPAPPVELIELSDNEEQDASIAASKCDSLLQMERQESPQGQPDAYLPENQHQPGNAASGQKQNEQMDIEQEKVKKQKLAPPVEVIELSDNEEQDASIAASKQTRKDLNSCVWYCVSSLGLQRGPYSMTVLKEWFDSSLSDLNFKVWKADQSPEDAIFLADAIRQAFSVR